MFHNHLDKNPYTSLLLPTAGQNFSHREDEVIY